MNYNINNSENSGPIYLRSKQAHNVPTFPFIKPKTSQQRALLPILSHRPTNSFSVHAKTHTGSPSPLLRHDFFHPHRITSSDRAECHQSLYCFSTDYLAPLPPYVSSSHFVARWAWPAPNRNAPRTGVTSGSASLSAASHRHES